MKTVFSSHELAHIWARQSQSNGRTPTGNFYFQQRDIFSYGSHFCIARIVRPVQIVFVTDRKYSNTTAKQVNRVWQAVRHFYQIVTVPYPNGNMADNAPTWLTQLTELLQRATNSRVKECNRIAALNTAKGIAANIQKYMDATGQTLKPGKYAFDNERKTVKQLAAIVEAVNANDPGKAFEGYNEKVAAIRKAEEAKKVRQQKKRIAELTAKIPDWKKGILNRDALRGLDTVYLREVFDGDRELVQTSQGAQVSKIAAHQLLVMIAAGRDIKGHDIDGYTVLGINGTLRIGCHTIERAEINDFAARMQWPERIAEEHE